MKPQPQRKRLDLRALGRNLFGTRLNTVITILTVLVVGWVTIGFVRWAVLDATWTGTAQDCRARGGACWSYVITKFRFMIYAFYPPELHWRPTLTAVLLVALVIVTAMPRFWNWRLLAVLWLVTPPLCWTLMAGWGLGPTVSTNSWGGLPLTLLFAIVCFAACFPIAVLLALARQSSMRGIRMLSVAFIELMRATPMVAILYVAMLILPMALPGGSLVDRLVRAMLLITLFWAAYLAEVVRGGLQTIPRGQYEAAAALGIGYWRTMRLVVLPQALRAVIPAIVNLAIGFFLATSLLAVIGIFDLLNTAKNAAVDTQWLGFYDESYFVAAIIYFVICFGASRYSLWLERYLGTGRGGASLQRTLTAP
jgi:general L-amino acid transport system permease protein